MKHGMLLFVTGIVVLTGIAGFGGTASAVTAQECVACHETVTPGIVREYQLSRHATAGTTCITCHGDAHGTAMDFQNARIPTPDVCAACHRAQYDQFAAGKHAQAWNVMYAMPTAHWQPMELMDGLKGCGGCHKIGLKTEDEMFGLLATGGYGVASCDVCHTRHQFSVREALAPQACRTCHMGVDHPQWEMYSASKHGVRAQLVQNGVLPEGTAAPTCQYCHMHEGVHEVRTAWGYLAVRLPMPDDEQWRSDRTTILRALGIVAGPTAVFTDRAAIIGQYDIARTDEASWQAERDRMLAICTDCHSGGFARGELEKGDEMIRQADRLMAQAIDEVAALYSESYIIKPDWYEGAYPDLLAFTDAETTVEQELFTMFNEYRMRAFQGSFHNNPDYAYWYGWSAMQRTLIEIRDLAANMRITRN